MHIRRANACTGLGVKIEPADAGCFAHLDPSARFRPTMDFGARICRMAPDFGVEVHSEKAPRRIGVVTRRAAAKRRSAGTALDDGEPTWPPRYVMCARRRL
jgi:hypothetical protein